MREFFAKKLVVRSGWLFVVMCFATGAFVANCSTAARAQQLKERPAADKQQEKKQTKEQNREGNATSDLQSKTLPPDVFLKWVEGRWEGEAKTWFRPGQLADQSKVEGRFERVFGGKFLRHRYTGSMKGKKRTGEETIVFNKARQKYQVTLMDTFHMNYGILFSTGTATANGFQVKGEYAISPKEKKWGWRTVYKKEGPNTLVITSYNIFPGGKEVKGVEVRYERITGR